LIVAHYFLNTTRAYGKSLIYDESPQRTELNYQKSNENKKRHSRLYSDRTEKDLRFYLDAVTDTSLLHRVQGLRIWSKVVS
jgi:hypothetical protein